MTKIERLYAHLKRYNYTGEVSIYEWSQDEIVVCISWGDWKHDHLRIEYLLGLMGYKKTSEKVTESDGSDCYSAEYLFQERSSYRYDAIRKLKSARTKKCVLKVF